MKIRIQSHLIFLCVLSLLAACKSGKETKEGNLAPNAHKVVAKEVIQGTNYTYVQVSSNTPDYWIAINKADIKEGETYYWSIGLEMNEFTVKELKRTFRSIFFV